MEDEELQEEMETLEGIIDIRKYRFRKDMHELREDLKKLKKELKAKGENVDVVVAEKEKAEAGVEK